MSEPEPDHLRADEPGADSDQANQPTEVQVDWRAFVPTDTADHLATMDRAARQSGCGVPWQLLAAIARVESNFGRNMATSSAGAIGYGQFLPSSWQTFGSEGNAYDYRDALPAIAAYLCRAGLARDPRAALFAYNHAEWYVDLVLDLAVRYDRMAPGGPVPEVLGTGPAAHPGPPLHYALERDAPFTLNVPWRGRKPGEPISPATLAKTALDMLRGAFGLSGDVPDDAVPETGSLADVADHAWQAGLLALTDAAQQSTLAGIREHISRGHPVLAVLNSAALPGHLPADDSGDQVVVVIGTTGNGLIYADPSFSSRLGYDLLLSDAEFAAGWQAASPPGRALAFAARPQPPPRQAHLREAVPPVIIARVTATPIPPTATPTGVPRPDVQPEAAATIATSFTILDSRSPPSAVQPQGKVDWTWTILAAAGGYVLAVFAIRRLRARR